MSDVVMIQPDRVVLAGDVEASEIRLGGTPRGLALLLTDRATPDIETVEVMNTLAAEGFESLAVRWEDGIDDAVRTRAAERGWQPEQIGVVGIGAGGTAALDLARTQLLGAAVSVSPAPDVTEVAASPQLRTPWLGMVAAGADLTPEEVRRLRSALDGGSDVYSKVVVYPGVGADFHRRTEDGISFAASYDCWQRTIEWLLARVVARPTPGAIAWRERQAIAR